MDSIRGYRTCFYTGFLHFVLKQSQRDAKMSKGTNGSKCERTRVKVKGVRSSPKKKEPGE
jgi:hypothetical protein